MAENRQYDHEYKVQAVRLAKEIGQAKAAKELGVPKNTMYGWVRAHRLGSLDLGAGSQTPQSAMSLNEELIQLRQLILSRLVDTFSTRILYPRQLLSFSGNYSIAVVWPSEEVLHWPSRFYGYSNS